jgi:transcriptional regulator with XRE-family HTH domain
MHMTSGTRTKKPTGGVRGMLPNAVTLALGQNLRHFREEAGLTQVELAFDAEVERSRISKIERGHINPSLLTLATLCYCLKITLPTLFDGVKDTLAPSWKGGALRRTNQAVLGVPPNRARVHR